MLTMLVRKVLRNHFPYEFCVEPVFARQISYIKVCLSTVRPVWNMLYQCGKLCQLYYLLKSSQSKKER